MLGLSSFDVGRAGKGEDMIGLRVFSVLIFLCGTVASAGVQNVSWTGEINAVGTGANLNGLTKNGGCDGCADSGAVSQQTIVSGDGYLDFIAASPLSAFYVGLSKTNTGTTATEITFAFNLWGNGYVDLRENGTYINEFAYKAGDHFRIAYEGGKVNYYQNNKWLYTSAQAPVFPAFAKTSLWSYNTTTGVIAALDSAIIGNVQNVAWASAVNATPTGTFLNGLKKSGGCEGCADSGAISQQTIGSGDGYFEFTATSPPGDFYIGLNNSSTGTTATEIPFAFNIWHNGYVDVRENGTYINEFAYKAGDRFRIAYEGGKVTYYQNGKLLYTSVKAPKYPAFVDTSFWSLASSVDNVTLALGLDSAPPMAATGHQRCGWIGANDALGRSAFIAHASWFKAIHPFWYRMQADSVSIGAGADVDNQAVVDAASANSVSLVPMVYGGDDPNPIRTMMNDPTKRAAHVQALVNLAVSRHYTGLDLDYEHMWTMADRAPYTAFIQQFATAMHAAGKEASIALPAIDAGSNGAPSAWDYTALSQALDHLHVMAYDFHTIGTHAGPTSPLGWVDSVSQNAVNTGHKEKFILGLPNYGVTPTWFCTLSDCLAACPSFLTSTTHMQSCSFGNWDPGRSLNCQTANGTLFFDDVASLEEKVSNGKSHQLGGVTYWAIGGELPGFFDMVVKYYP